MKKFIQNKLKDQKGLTLIELLAVIVIIAIIAAIAIPAIGNIIENSRYSAVKSDGLNTLAAANIYFTENSDKTTVSTTELKSGGFLENTGKIPAPANASGSTADNYVSKNGTGTLALTTAEITFSGSKKIKFTNATVGGINANVKKGSEVSGTETINN